MDAAGCRVSYEDNVWLLLQQHIRRASHVLHMSSARRSKAHLTCFLFHAVTVYPSIFLLCLQNALGISSVINRLFLLLIYSNVFSCCVPFDIKSYLKPHHLSQTFSLCAPRYLQVCTVNILPVDCSTDYIPFLGGFPSVTVANLLTKLTQSRCPYTTEFWRDR